MEQSTIQYSTPLNWFTSSRTEIVMHYYTTHFFTVKLKLVPLFSAAAAPEQEKDEDSNACTDTNCKIPVLFKPIQGCLFCVIDVGAVQKLPLEFIVQDIYFLVMKSIVAKVVVVHYNFFVLRVCVMNKLKVNKCIC
mmetsp:Transcript_21539/g.31886  ORF Transcript_21539/g.31886 Transcript_21539/m.31886 type:complete len:136 (-) Transcript_21539:51-458(-)